MSLFTTLRKEIGGSVSLARQRTFLVIAYNTYAKRFFLAWRGCVVYFIFSSNTITL